jgi:hypothetical protein
MELIFACLGFGVSAIAMGASCSMMVNPSKWVPLLERTLGI